MANTRFSGRFGYFEISEENCCSKFTFPNCLLSKNWTSGHTSRPQKYRVNYTITTIIP
jgi:hypothetical protein